MANEEHVKILNKGVVAWNQWRLENPTVIPDLGAADLRQADLTARFLRGANLAGARLTGVNLSGANLSRANLFKATLLGADLSKAVFTEAVLNQATLIGANLCQASFMAADLSGVSVEEADFTDSVMGFSRIGKVNLALAKGLETVRHIGPSSVGIDTIYLSQGKIPEVFLREAGVPESFITYIKSLVVEPIEYYSSFISYSTKDQEFADLLRSQLQRKGARVWLATEDLKIGDRFRARIDEAIRLFDKLLLVLSKDSVKSPWVEAEVEAAFEKERRQKRTVLFPIRLDDAVMETEEAWAAEIRRTRHIGDFRKWKDHDEYQKAFGRLMRDLKAGEKMAR
jgi:TIR domain/Pentapeptide repeats (8 copies)